VTIDGLLASIAGFDRLPVAALVVDVDGTVIAANAHAMKLGWLPSIGAKAWSGRAQEGDWDVEVTTPTTKRWVRWMVAAHEHAGRQYFIACVVDMTERMSSTQSERLESLGLVAGGVAHEFNNQLVSVVSDASLLREDETLNEEQREAVARIDGAARRMTQLTRQLLAFAGRGRFVTTLLDPDALLADTRPRITRKVLPTVAVHLDVSGDTVAVEADRALLRQVILDLVENAAEACGGTGTIHIASRVVGAMWQLEVRDDGIGMDAGTLARIFDPFFSTKPDHRGLGLSAVMGIVRRLGGDITASSQPKQGTSFLVRLPIVPGVAPPRRRSTSEQPPMTRLTGLRILVADDEPSVRQTIQRMMTRRNAIPVLASDGAEAEQLLRTQSFDIVLLDVMMPKRTGYQLVPIARETQPSSPVILMSGYSEQARGVEPPDAFIEKPFNAAMLEAAIQAAMRAESPNPTNGD
jgi:signal transduction histidine kinase/CheY-like chemotaxis protein